jgi:hypothetical protein
MESDPLCVFSEQFGQNRRGEKVMKANEEWKTICDSNRFKNKQTQKEL